MKSKVKSFIRRIFYHSRLAQALVGAVSIAARRTDFVPVLHFLSYEEGRAIGPLQRDEAIALFGITRVLRPATVVEFGFFHGHSAFNFLEAIDTDSKLFSYDVDPESLRRAKAEFFGFRNFRLLSKSMCDFHPADIEHRKVDLVFFDAAHDIEPNRETFRKVLPHLSEGALIVIHDTGAWSEAGLTDLHREFISKLNPQRTPEGHVIHQPDEREFVDWITTEYPEFAALHLHSTRVLRHGMSLLQKQARLGGGLSNGC
ncbi:MAG: class I SAM-dependent methyltransferase [Terrimicrobiaceae bacterium]